MIAVRTALFCLALSGVPGWVSPAQAQLTLAQQRVQLVGLLLAREQIAAEVQIGNHLRLIDTRLRILETPAARPPGEAARLQLLAQQWRQQLTDVNRLASSALPPTLLVAPVRPLNVVASSSFGPPSPSQHLAVLRLEQQLRQQEALLDDRIDQLSRLSVRDMTQATRAHQLMLQLSHQEQNLNARLIQIERQAGTPSLPSGAVNVLRF